MLRLDKLITDRVLKRLQSVRGSADSRPDGLHSPIRLREVKFADCAAVSALKTRYKLKQDSLENWQRLWKNNPVVEDSKQMPIGWVLEADEGIVGYLGNIPLRCFYRGTMLSVAATHGLVVRPECRAYTAGLVSAYCRQKGVDLLVATSAGEASGKIFEAFKAQPLPQPDYHTALFWVVDAPGFLSALQEALRVKGTIATLSRHVGSQLLRAEQVLRRRCPHARTQKCDVRELSPSAIDDDFDVFWQKKVAVTTRLMTDRSAIALRWHFDIPGDQRRPIVLRCDYSGRMVGYAILVTKIKDGIRKAYLADIVVEDEESFVAQELLIAGFEYARRSKHHVFEVLGFPRLIRRICSEWNPYSRNYPSSPYLFKAADHDLHGSLRSENAWYATPYDGDATLMPQFEAAKAPARAEQFELV